MEVYRDSDGHLVYRTGPMGSGLTVFTVLGVLGCSAPFLLAGPFLFWWGLGDLLEGRSDSWLFLATGTLAFVFGGAFLAFFLSTKRRGSREYRTTLKRGEEVLKEVLDREGRCLESDSFRLGAGSKVVGTSELRHVAGGRGGTSKERFYLSTVLGEAGEKVQIESRQRSYETLPSLLLVAGHLKLPLEIDWLPQDVRPGSTEGLSTNEPQETYVMSEDGKQLVVDLRAGVHRVDTLSRIFPLALIGSGMLLALMGLSSGDTAFAVFGGGLAGFMALVFSGLVWGESTKAQRLEISEGRLTWYQNGDPILDVPLEKVLELAIVEEGLRFVFPDRVQGLLTGTEGREERAFLFRLIEAAWKANGLSGFEGPFGSRVLSP